MQFFVAVDKISADSASHVLSAIAELLDIEHIWR